MRKLGDIIFISILAIFIGFTATVNAETKELGLQTVGDLVLDKNSNASSFYIVGKYVFTMNFVDTNNLNAEDLMIAARSITLTLDDGEKIKGTNAYDKMSVYQIIALTDDDGNVTGWRVGENLLGKNTIDNNSKFEIDYIDYQKVNNVTFKVTFDNDNNSESTNQTVEYNQTVSEPKPNPTKEGYDFKGWYKCLNADCTKLDTEKFDFNNTHITEDTKLKAKWEIKKFTVIFDNDNNEDVVKQTVEYNKTIAKPKTDPKKQGYKFKGWYKCTNTESCDNLSNESVVFDFNTPITEDIKLKAMWEQIKYTVTFKAIVDGEENAEFLANNNVQLTYPFKLTKEQIPPTPEGYTLLGWIDDSNNQIGINNLTARIFTRDTTITGNWESKKFTVSFDTDGGETIGNALISYGKTLTDPGEAIKKNNDEYNAYEFAGWYKCLNDDCTELDANKFNFENTPITEDTKLKAKFDKKVYTNKVVAKFVDSLKSDDFSAYTTEDTMMTFNIKNRNVSLSQSFNAMIVALKNALKVKNIENITLNYNTDKNLILTKDSDVYNEMQTFFTELSSVEYNVAKLKDLNGKKFTMIVNLTEGYTDEENDHNDSYDVEFTSNYIEVHNENELKNALTSGKEIIIEKWDGSITEPITINNDVVIDAENTNIISDITSSKYTFIIESGNVVIKDLTLTIDILKPNEYEKTKKKANVLKNTIGIKVEKDTSLTVNNFHVKTKDKITGLTIDGQTLDASTVTINENAAIELYGTLYGSDIYYESEIYGSPTVLARKYDFKDSDAIKDAEMNLKGLSSQEKIYNVIRTNDIKNSHDNLGDVVSTFTNYYKDYNHSYLSFAWYNSDKSSIHPFAFLYDENLIIPEIFKENGNDYNYKKSDGNYKLTGWKSRNFTGIKSSQDLTKIKINSRETYYLYTNYEKEN